MNICDICDKPIYHSIQRRVMSMGYYDIKVKCYHYDCLHDRYPHIARFETE